MLFTLTFHEKLAHEIPSLTQPALTWYLALPSSQRQVGFIGFIEFVEFIEFIELIETGDG